MVKGFENAFCLKIGYLNDRIEERRDAFRSLYDVVLPSEAGLEAATKTLGYILSDRLRS